MHTAVILAGGIGSRLGSLTTNFPKPMLHVKDEPFLILLMKNIRRFGIKNFILLSGHANEILISHFEKNYYDFNVKIIVEKELLGTGGAIKNAVDILPNEFFCFNGDSILLGNWLKIKDHAKEGVLASVALTSVDDSDRFGNVKIDNNNHIESFTEKKSSSNIINAGIYFFHKKIFEDFKGEKFSIERDIIPDLLKSRTVKGEIIDGYFIDIGIKDSLEQAQHKDWNEEKQFAVVFDRDGTITEDKGYTYKTSDLKIKPYFKKLIFDLNNKNILVFVATNQSGIARGYFSEKEMHAFHKSLSSQLYESSCHIDGFYYSPYHPDGIIEKYKKNSTCRKPNTGMLEQIKRDWYLQRKNMLMIGDSDVDIECADNFGIKSYRYSDKINLKDMENFIYKNFNKHEKTVR